MLLNIVVSINILLRIYSRTFLEYWKGVFYIFIINISAPGQIGQTLLLQLYWFRQSF